MSGSRRAQRRGPRFAAHAQGDAKPQAKSQRPSRKRLRPPRVLTYVDAVARHGSIR